MNTSNKVPAIVMSLCINGLGVVRALGSHGVPVIGISGPSFMPGKFSKYVNEVWETSGDEEDIVDLLIKKGISFEDRPVVFPITDVGVRCVSDRYEEIIKYYRIGLPDRNLVNSLISKKGISGWVEKLNLSAPKTFYIDDSEKIYDVLKKVEYPCIVKPEYRSSEFSSAAGQKAYKAVDEKGLLSFYNSFSAVDPRAVIQEWIDGGDGEIYFCLQYYNSKSEKLVSFTGRKMRQWPPLCGGTASCEPFASDEIEKITTEFFKNVGFIGLCSMEYKKDVKTGNFFIVEPTIGRTDWQSDIATINGVPIPFVAYCDLVNLEIPSIKRTKIKYRWIRWSADVASSKYYIGKKEITTFDWVLSLLVPVRWSIWRFYDPAPYLRFYLRKITKKIDKTFNIVLDFCEFVKKKIHRFIFSKKYNVYQKKLNVNTNPVFDKFYFKLAKNEDISLVARQFASHFNNDPVSQLDKKISSGEKLILGFMKGDTDICFVAWVSDIDYLFKNTPMEVRKNKSLCLYKILVPEKYRKLKVGTCGVEFIEWYFSTCSYEFLYAYVLLGNKASNRMFEKLKWDRVATIKHIRLFFRDKFVVNKTNVG